MRLRWFFIESSQDNQNRSESRKGRTNMTRRIIAAVILMLALAGGNVTRADDLDGASTFLCAPAEATVCTPGAGCVTGPLWKWDIPTFIIVDLADEVLATTKASGLERSTPIQNMQRDGERIFVQGTELGRAYSFVIDENAGFASFAVVMANMTITAFGACTPADPAEKRETERTP